MQPRNTGASPSSISSRKPSSPTNISPALKPLAILSILGPQMMPVITLNTSSGNCRVHVEGGSTGFERPSAVAKLERSRLSTR